MSGKIRVYCINICHFSDTPSVSQRRRTRSLSRSKNTIVSRPVISAHSSICYSSDIPSVRENALLDRALLSTRTYQTHECESQVYPTDNRDCDATGIRLRERSIAGCAELQADRQV